ncbi:MAG TPA: hypothetical protein VMY05_06825 [Acidobacteriota bacterium]|nr:hypothetical protein [Acidobacteriota bacterium]
MPAYSRISLAAPVILALIILGSLFLVKLPEHTNLWREAGSFGHLPLFGLLSLVFLNLSRRLLGAGLRTRLNHYRLALAASIVSGGLVELVQYFGPRDADLWDLALDAVGSLVFLAVVATFDRHLSEGDRPWGRAPARAIRAAAVLLVLAGFIPTGLWLGSYAYRSANLPCLCRFESFWENRFLAAAHADLEITPSPTYWRREKTSKTAHVLFKPAPYSTVALVEPYPDWTGYRSLAMTLFNPRDTAVTLDLRIHDRRHNNQYHDRYNKTLSLSPGENVVTISLNEIEYAPVGRRLDMRSLAAVSLFAADLSDTLSVFLDEVCLR